MIWINDLIYTDVDIDTDNYKSKEMKEYSQVMIWMVMILNDRKQYN